MNDRQRARSYEYYKRWQINKNRYRHECVAYVLMVGFGLMFVLSHLPVILIGLGVALMIGGGSLSFNLFRKWYKMKKSFNELEQMVRSLGAKDVSIDSETKTISCTMPSEKVDSVLTELKNAMGENGVKLKAARIENKAKENAESGDEVMKNSVQKTTEAGYINRNNQRNNGRSDERGTDANQWFYFMECLNCGEKYKANGSDIFQRKCPSCQGGRP